MHKATKLFVHIGGRSGMIGVIVSEEKPADLGWIDAVFFDIAQDLIGLAVRTADAGVDQRELSPPSMTYIWQSSGCEMLNPVSPPPTRRMSRVSRI